MTGARDRQRVKNECFSSFNIAIPPSDLMKKFTMIVKPMFESIYNLTRRNENLEKQRDMLLLKLISGQIKI